MDLSLTTHFLGHLWRPLSVLVLREEHPLRRHAPVLARRQAPVLTHRRNAVW
jgi:hypothetical protein